ncbi:DNA-directed RNA polymerase subunit omega [Priestia taiwanensis]|uniref:DNA-directed RNA polymerase subunit omega n=1 Tax=Priestia taiwanensis TaxID=1347902 RepID=A0A917EQD1_9BACI|nr:DNA-directed RNA polymerase subunit omega [Priestia taiwanensis]MBM7362893.1 DNA-directed RNA polymerase subunit omega [Priestia taiwanensis]GGE65969.1 DNA-directed RNA polymerase subunit omega [Priestia taiwanensis]
MLNPSIDSLMEKLDSKYTLVTVSAKRARQMQEDKTDTVVEKPVSHKFVGKALEEINEGLLHYRRLDSANDNE